MVWQQVLHNEAVLRGGQEVGHLVVIGVPRQPRLDNELVGAVAAGHQTIPAHQHAGQRNLRVNRCSDHFKYLIDKSTCSTLGGPLKPGFAPKPAQYEVTFLNNNIRNSNVNSDDVCILFSLCR